MKLSAYLGTSTNNQQGIMSKQLAISAAFSVLAMAAFTLHATAAQPNPLAQTQTGAEAYAAAPAASPSVTGLISINR